MPDSMKPTIDAGAKGPWGGREKGLERGQVMKLDEQVIIPDRGIYLGLIKECLDKPLSSFKELM